MTRVTKADWKTEPFSPNNITITLDRTFSNQEVDLIKLGLIPEEMEDKWFIYWKDNRLYFHRSWTGIGIYIIHFDFRNDIYHMSSVEIDGEFYSNYNGAHEKLISSLIDNLMLIQNIEDIKINSENQDNVQQEKRFIGALIGLAVGDAIGTTVEFARPGSFEPMTDMIGGGPYNLNAGEWTDDTAMALCLAESLVLKGYDRTDQMERYCRWMDEGYMSSNGNCFDIGTTVARALINYQHTGNPYSGPTEERTAGNGSLMRLVPIPMYFFNNPELAIEKAGDMSRTTHGAQEAIDACRYFTGLLIGALQGESKEVLLSKEYAPINHYWQNHKLSSSIRAIANGSYKVKQPPEIIGSGYVVKSMEAALWAFCNSSSFEEGVLLAVNLGNDADTTAAIYGQLAGAYYGVDAIAERWKGKIVKKSFIEELAIKLNKEGLTKGA